jgi:glycogen operon protein
MLLAGDEFGRSQQGNNNAYCQDDDISWVQWGAIDGAGEQLEQVARQLIRLRIDYPVLRRGRFLSGEWIESQGLKAATWLAPSGDEMKPEQWDDPATRSFGLLLDGRAPATSIPRPAADASVLMLFNAWVDGVEFKLPPHPAGGHWHCVLDTTEAGRCHGPVGDDDSWVVTGSSMIVFVSELAQP